MKGHSNLTDYTFTLRHDRGTVKITVRDSNQISAKRRVMDDQLCPERAIINVRSKHLW